METELTNEIEIFRRAEKQNQSEGMILTSGKFRNKQKQTILLAPEIILLSLLRPTRVMFA